MAADTHSDRTQEKPGVSLFELSIYMINSGTNPSLINPEFLRENEIVDRSWGVTRPVIIEPTSSFIRYNNGLSVTATNEQVVISQRAARRQEGEMWAPMALDDIVCPNVATQLLRIMPTDQPYELVTIDPFGWMEIETNDRVSHVSPLLQVANLIPFKGTIPTLQTKTVYALDDKEVTLFASEISQQSGGELSTFHFGGEFRRTVIGSNRQEQTEYIEHILDEWRQDIEDFNELACQFVSMMNMEVN